MGYVARAIETIDNTVSADMDLVALRSELDHYRQLATRVVSQTERRVLFGEKVCLTGGASNLIIDCVITDGNPADSTLTEQMLDRQKEIYGRYPLKVALDGGFASKKNLEKAKEKKIKDVCFAKKRGLEVADMCRSQWVYKRLRRFRAGIEAGISWLKRCFGMIRCMWKGLRSFKSYVWASIVSANLLTIARRQLARENLSSAAFSFSRSSMSKISGFEQMPIILR